MKIRFRDAHGAVTEFEVATDFEKNVVVDVSTEIGEFYLESSDLDKSNQKKNARSDRHISLERISGYVFRDVDGQAVRVHNKPDQPKYAIYQQAQLEVQMIREESLAQIMSCLDERQRYLIRNCILEGRSYTDLAVLEGRHESTIRRAVKGALKKILKNSDGLPDFAFSGGIR